MGILIEFNLDHIDLHFIISASSNFDCCVIAATEISPFNGLIVMIIFGEFSVIELFETMRTVERY